MPAPSLLIHHDGNGRPDFTLSTRQRQGTGKYHGVVGLAEAPMYSIARQNAREWCFVCARKGRDPYHRWDEHLRLEQEAERE